MLRILIALMLLAFPAFAGTHTFATSTVGGTVTLDTPPPGAASLRVRFVSSTSYLGFGYEHQDTSGGDFYGATQTHALVIRDGTTDIAIERAMLTMQDYAEPYDGTTDYAGLSGLTVAETRVKGTTPWETYNALPTTLTLQKRNQLAYSYAGLYYSTNWPPTQSTCTIEWEWQ